MAKKKKVKAKIDVEVDKKKNKPWIIIAIIVVLVAIFSIFVMQSKPIQTTSTTSQGEEQQQQTTTELIGDVCQRDNQCFLVSCKATPSVLDCINVTHQATYPKQQCNSYSININYNPSKCACVQGICSIK